MASSEFLLQLAPELCCSWPVSTCQLPPKSLRLTKSNGAPPSAQWLSLAHWQPGQLVHHLLLHRIQEQLQSLLLNALNVSISITFWLFDWIHCSGICCQNYTKVYHYAKTKCIWNENVKWQPSSRGGNASALKMRTSSVWSRNWDTAYYLQSICLLPASEVDWGLSL